MSSYPFSGHCRLLAPAALLVLLSFGPAHAASIEVTEATSPFSMEFRDADIKDVLRAVGQAANLNLVVSDTVAGQVSMSLKDVDIWDALESILKTKGLTYVREENIIRVVAVSESATRTWKHAFF